MLNECGKRAAHLAVSRYGADAAQVHKVLQDVVKAQARGESVDVLDAFVNERILSQTQVRELRVGLETTRVDPASPKNGFNLANRLDHATLPPPSEQATVEALSEENAGVPRMIGDYRILRRLGEGGTGTVFLAYQEKENRQVAIKILAEQLAKNQAALDRFYREAKSGALLHHPNIVRNLAIGRDQTLGLHYLVLEFVDGPSALELLEQFGHMPVGDAVHIVLDSARGLEHAHSRNVVHRDIKPGNILLTQSGLAKLADLGLAKRTDEASHLTHARQGFGTPYYMPYEQAMNAKGADARSDIYALGATFYHLLVGEVPFPGATSLEIVDKKGVGHFTAASSLNPDVPHALDHILSRMLAKDPRDRYQTASELIVDLERTNLSATVPSFTDPDRAMRDPVVRKRLTSPAQTTSLDLRKGNKPLVQEAIWLLRYHDQAGHLCKAKLTHDQVVLRLQRGKITPQTEAARVPNNEFKPLVAYKEFQKHSVDLAETQPTIMPQSEFEAAETLPVDSSARRERLWILALFAGVIMVVATTIILLKG